MAKQDDYARYTIRIPTGLYERVKAAAGDKSFNAEIIATLEEKYPAPRYSPDTEELGRFLSSLVAMNHDEAMTEIEKHVKVKRVNSPDGDFLEYFFLPAPLTDG